MLRLILRLMKSRKEVEHINETVIEIENELEKIRAMLNN